MQNAITSNEINIIAPQDVQYYLRILFGALASTIIIAVSSGYLFGTIRGGVDYFWIYPGYNNQSHLEPFVVMILNGAMSASFALTLSYMQNSRVTKAKRKHEEKWALFALFIAFFLSQRCLALLVNLKLPDYCC